MRKFLPNFQQLPLVEIAKSIVGPEFVVGKFPQFEAEELAKLGRTFGLDVVLR